MNKTLPVYWYRIPVLMKKELLLLGMQPVVYLAAAVFTASCAFQFFLGGQFFVYGKGSTDLRFFFTVIPYISILTVPVLTMSLWDKNMLRFDESLPATEGQIVVAKWGAAFAAAVLMLVPGIAVPFAVSLFGDIDTAQLVTGYLGIFLYDAAAVASGVFFGVLVSGRVAAFLVSSLVLAVCTGIHVVPLYLNVPDLISGICSQISFAWHFDAAGKGIIDSRDVVFYGVVTGGFLTGAAAILRMRKRGRL